MRIISLFLLLNLIGSCTELATIIPEINPCKVTLKDYRSNTNLFLVNDAHTDLAEYYSKARKEASLKIIDNMKMGALMLQLEDYGFFESATPALRRTPGARTTLMVERGGLNYSLSMTTKDIDSVELAKKCNQAFTAVYDSEFSMQLIDNEKGRAFFENQQRQLGNQGKRNFR